MNQNDIRKKLNLGVSQTLIAENEYGIDKAGRNICALLNSGGGNIVFIDSTAYKTDQEYNIYNDITPKAVLSLEKKVIVKHSALCFEVPAGKDTPYSYKNVIYVRERNETIPADIETVKDMIIKKQNEPIRWERRFSDAEYDSDFDENHFKEVLSSIKRVDRIKLKNYEHGFEYLEFFSLYKYGRITNAGDVLFCKNPARRLPQIRAKAALFANDKTDSTYLDMKNFEGPLLEIFNELYNFIFRNTPTLAHFYDDNPKRKDQPLYPPKAVKEALVNALVHRNYSDYKGSVSVFIYPDRLEIWNYGEFPKGVTVDNLSKGNVSVLRNPDIAYIMYLQEFMERLGRGATLIKNECKENGLPEPQWKSEKGLGVTLTFFAPEKSPKRARKEPESDLQGTKSGLSRDQAGTKSGLSRDDEVMLKFCEDQDRTLSEIMTLFNRSNKTKFRDSHIKHLLDKGFIELTNPEVPTSPNQKYRITEAGKKTINI
ncbi:MAG: transcriptional regulator [Candidatus Delongbacteria bacterium]|nr:transcriptional regulator [Candidatus Delongbacteria bacterium]